MVQAAQNWYCGSRFPCRRAFWRYWRPRLCSFVSTSATPYRAWASATPGSWAAACLRWFRAVARSLGCGARAGSVFSPACETVRTRPDCSRSIAPWNRWPSPWNRGSAEASRAWTWGAAFSNRAGSSCFDRAISTATACRPITEIMLAGRDAAGTCSASSITFRQRSRCCRNRRWSA